MKHRWSTWACVATLVLAAGELSSQDSHYWTEQFGNRARLLGGAVIGGGTDIAVVYYNPGALALMEKPEILLAGNVFQVRKIKAEPQSPEAEGSRATSLSLSPSLFAGQLRREVLGGKFAYSFLTRARADFRLEGQSSLPSDEIGLPNTLFTTNNAFLEQDLGEYWFGGTWSRSFSENLGLGVSTFFATRSHTARFQDSFTALTAENRAGASSFIRDFSYYNVRLLWKLGMATNWEKWQLGFTLTTPSLSLFGSGTSTIDSSVVVQAVDPSTMPATFVAADRQSVSSDYRSPLSIGVGASRVFGATKVYLSSEWFDGVEPYAILDTEPFQSQSSGETFESDISQELASVLNVAVGIEHSLRDGRRLYASFWTDFNAATDSGEANSAVSPFDLYHFGGGYSFEAGNSDVTLGGIVAVGSAKTGLDFRPPETSQSILNTSFVRLTFLLGFNFSLGTGG